MNSKTSQAQTKPSPQTGLLQRLNHASKCSCDSASASPSSPIAKLWHAVRQRQCLLTQICFIAIMIYILLGCQNQNISTAQPLADEHNQDSKLEPESSISKNFAPGTLLDLLAAEIAGYRDQPLYALEQYSQQALLTRDPQIAQRAYEIADYLGAHQVGQVTALLWVELEPNSAQAQQAAALELYRAKDFKPANLHLRRAMELTSENDSDYTELVAFAVRQSDAQSLQQLELHIEQLLEQQPKQLLEQHRLLLASAIVLMPDQPLKALAQLERINDLQANSRTLHIKARMLQQLGQLEASVATQSALIGQEPSNENARKFRAHLFISMGRLEEALADFLELNKLDPTNDDYRLSLGYVNMDMKAWEEAIVYFEELLLRGSHQNAALYNLASCHAELDNQEQALNYYQQIEPGPYWLDALQQQALLLMLAKQHDAFELLLDNAIKQQPQQLKNIYLVQTRTHMQFKQDQQALHSANQALQRFADDKDLLYLRALTAERLGDLQQLEIDLGKILQLNPNDSSALNALGYTLVDRTNRLEEGFELIQKALTLNPKDPPTMDSLGWAYYRLGQPEKALNYLQQAMQAMPDAEIAAHLGEVLWSKGKKRQARKIWQQGLELDAEDEVLLETIDRLDKRKSKP